MRNNYDTSSQNPESKITNFTIIKSIIKIHYGIIIINLPNIGKINSVFFQISLTLIFVPFKTLSKFILLKLAGQLFASSARFSRLCCSSQRWYSALARSNSAAELKK